jgi:hypothetical protein
MRDEELRGRFGQNGRKKVLETFDAKRNVEKLVAGFVA